MACRVRLVHAQAARRLLGNANNFLEQALERTGVPFGPIAGLSFVGECYSGALDWISRLALASVALRAVLWPLSFYCGACQSCRSFWHLSAVASSLDPSRNRDETEHSTLHSVVSAIRDTSTRPLSFVAGAAVAGLYIDLTIVFYSVHDRNILVSIFGIFAALCACAACVTLPAIWKDLSRGLKTAGISLTALGAVAQFWYQSIYVPENTPAGMAYTVAVGSVVQSGNERLRPSQLDHGRCRPAARSRLGIYGSREGNKL